MKESKRGIGLRGVDALDAQVRRVRLCVALCALLLLPLGLPLASAAEDARWEHHVALEAPGDPAARILSRGQNLASRFLVPSAWGNVTVEVGAVDENDARGILPLNGTIVIERAVALASSARSLALVDLAAQTLPEGDITFDLPDGWVATDPSRGLVLMGPALRVDAWDVGPRRVEGFGLSPEDHDLLAHALPYLRAVHGADEAPLLVARLPEGALREPIASQSALAIPADAGDEAFANALVAAHRAYRVVEVPPTSAAWFREGETRLHAALALVAAGRMNGSEVNELVTRGRAVADPHATLPDAPAASTLARQKGLVVVRALDAAIRNASGGRASLADLVERAEDEPQGPGRIDSTRLEALASEVAGISLADLFRDNVYGSSWPAAPSVVDAADVFVTALRVTPPQVAPGETMTLSYDVVNRGTRPAQLELGLIVDGATERTLTLELLVGGSATPNATLVLHEPGTHTIRIEHADAQVRVLSPPRLGIARVSTTPERPRAEEPFQLLVYVENRGGLPGDAQVELIEGDRLLQRTTQARVAGESTRALTLPLSLRDAGSHILRVELVANGTQSAVDHELRVEPTPDVRETPGLAAWAALVVAGLARMRRRR